MSWGFAVLFAIVAMFVFLFLAVIHERLGKILKVSESAFMELRFIEEHLRRNS